MPATRPTHYGRSAIIFHWLVALLFLSQIVLGFFMTQAESMALQFELIQVHKSLGFVVLALAILRVVSSLVARRPAPVATLTGAERTASAIVQAVLLAATVLVPLSGWALASTSTLDIPSFWFDLVIVPDLPLARSDAAEGFWRGAHDYLAYAAAVLAAGHASAALRHHFVQRDAVLLRMLAPWLLARKS